MSEIIVSLYALGFMWFWFSEHFFDEKMWRRSPRRSQEVQIICSLAWPITVPVRAFNMRKKKKAKEGRSNG